MYIIVGAALALALPYPFLYSAYQFVLMAYYLIISLREEVSVGLRCLANFNKMFQLIVVGYRNELKSVDSEMFYHTADVNLSSGEGKSA